MSSKWKEFVPMYYNRDRIIAELGPDAGKFVARTEYFTGLWDSWDNIVRIKPVRDLLNVDFANQIDDYMEDAGYDAGFDFQIRGREVRFVDETTKAAFMLTCSEFIQ